MAQKTLEPRRVLEGTWEEVSQHAGDLAGKRVKVLVYPQAHGEAEQPDSLAELLAGRIGRFSFGPKNLARNHREHFARIMDAKRKEGHI
jgi:hypothetical protein